MREAILLFLYWLAYGKMKSFFPPTVDILFFVYTRGILHLNSEKLILCKNIYIYRFQACFESIQAFLRVNCASYGTAVRKKQWPLHLNDAVSIFQSWQGGGVDSPGIIVTRPTGCPEEEVRAELYASARGRGGSREGGFHFFRSSLSASSRVSLKHGAAASTRDAVTPLR